MRCLLDHMVPKNLKKTMKFLGHEAFTAWDLNLHELKNGALYQASNARGLVLITFDSDYSDEQLG